MVSAIILAAGSSSRMNGINKQLSAVGDIPVVAMSMQRFERCERVGEIILAAPEAECARYRSLAEKYGITKLKAVVSGGETRFLSVKSALRYVSDGAEYLAIHDGARPLIETREIGRVIADAERYGAAIAGIRAVDTVKSVGADGFVESTPPRASLFYAQTPQVFYVSEVGWISSVLFLLILQDKLALADGKGRSTRAAWLTPAVGVPLMVFFCTYGDILSNLIWCGLIMLVSFRAICGLSQKRARAFHAAALCFAVAEYALWTAGGFFESDSLRSPCFYLDLLLTGTVLALFPAARRAVES